MLGWRANVHKWAFQTGFCAHTLTVICKDDRLLMLNKTDRASVELQAIIGEIRRRWTQEQLPKDLRRLALNVGDIARLLKVPLDELWKCVDEATAAGAGTKTLNLSPHGAILSALLQQRGPDVFQHLANVKRGHVFVPLEIELPSLPKGVSDRIVRPLLPVEGAISTSASHLDTVRETVHR